MIKTNNCGTNQLNIIVQPSFFLKYGYIPFKAIIVKTFIMIKHNGIMRITPAHDLVSLQIAKDHELPIDYFAIDQDGRFTKHA